MADSGSAPQRLDLRSHDVDDKRAELLRIFPGVRTEGNLIDFDRLQIELGATVDIGKERYGLTWPGKTDCVRAIQTPSLGTLRPRRDLSIDWDSTQNLLIEGDNLEVLKLLQKSYLGRVKLIYIDPPYNSGTDFIYPDKYAESLQTYLEYTGQVDAEGRKFSTNAETDGRFHSKWLSMMLPRLYLARDLLSDDGVVFVSIDDNEAHHLRMLMNEIFGEENFMACIVWEKKYTRSNDATWFSANHDFIYVYGRTRDDVLLNAEPRTADQAAAYSNPDDHPRGPWKATPLHAKSGRDTGFRHTFKNGVEWAPPIGTFPRFSHASLDRMDQEGAIWFGKNGQAIPSRKTFLADVSQGVTPVTIWPHEHAGNTHEANNELKALGLAGVFENPKPTKLIRRIIELATSPLNNDLVLDFFAGSGTTAQAVLDANAADGGNRRFILIQLPEPCAEGSQAATSGFSTIAEIAAERVRRAIKQDGATKAQLALGSAAAAAPGFRLFELAESNFRSWDAHVAHDVNTVTQQLEMHIEHVREGRTDEDLLYELVLKSGFEPTLPIKRVACGDKTVHSIADGALFICLERELTLDAIRAMADRKPQRVVCLDDGFAHNDQLKANAAQAFKTRDIVFKTV